MLKALLCSKLSVKKGSWKKVWVFDGDEVGIELGVNWLAWYALKCKEKSNCIGCRRAWSDFPYGVRTHPPAPGTIWLMADHSYTFLPGELPSDHGNCLSWKCLEGFVNPLKASADWNGVAKAQTPCWKAEQAWSVIYAQELLVGSGWN